MGELVHESQLRPSGQHGVDVHLLELRAAVGNHFAGHDLEVPDELGGPRASVGLDESDHHIRPPVMPAPAFVEHGKGLSDPGHRSHVDTELTSGADGVWFHPLAVIDRT